MGPNLRYRGLARQDAGRLAWQDERDRVDLGALGYSDISGAGTLASRSSRAHVMQEVGDRDGPSRKESMTASVARGSSSIA